MMRFDCLTLFPEMFNLVLGESIIGRAQKNGIIQVNTINIRDFSKNKHKKVDDYPYGGGSGMIMTPQPIYDAYTFTIKDLDKKPKCIYMSPQGRVLNQKIVEEIKNEKHVILLCGHYEGVDERIIEEIVDDEISIGDYVLTGGELPAMVLIDCVSRMVPGVLSTEDSFKDESHFNGLLEYPQYTRPEVFLNKRVPEVLLSGHHLNIKKWRVEQAIRKTLLKRPELYKKQDNEG